MSWLITSDTHFSEKPKDGYRLKLLPWLAKQQEIHKPQATFHLGDLCEKKDNYPASLVNKIVDGLIKLKPPLFILRGNHDCINPDEPFFRFLNEIEGLTFVIDYHQTFGGLSFVAHQRIQSEFDKRITQIPMGNTILCHQTFDGAIAETGAIMSGLSASLIEKKLPWRVYSGTYISPRHVVW